MQQVLGFLQDTVLFLVMFVRGVYRSLSENKGLAAVSVVLAFGIWIVVIEADNPTRTTVVPHDIPVEPINVPPGVAVVEPVQTVRVRVAAPDDTFEDLTAANFQATVDLDGFTVGTFDEVEVEVDAVGPGTGDVRVEAVLPETITITLATLTSKEVPIIPEIKGNLVSGYTMSSPELDDSVVIVSGPQAEVDKVIQATAEINVEGLSDDIDQAVRLVARDAQGVLIPGVRLTPDLTSVKIEVEQQKFSRSMAISVNITDSPAEGYNVISVSVNPPTVTIRGGEAFIEGTASIPTRPLSIDGETEDVIRTVSLDLPTGAEVTGGVPVVTVTVRIAPAVGRYQFSVPVSVEDLGEDVAVQGALPAVTVTLEGPLPLLKETTPSDIGAVVNLGGDGAGTHLKEVEIAPPDGTTLVTTDPATINITLVGR
jgi:YbbR domain-containing protein